MIESDGIKVYSQDYMLCGHIIQKHSPVEVEEFEAKIVKEGNRNINGFFYATIPKNGKKKKNGVNVVEIKINTKKIQPMEGW